MTDEKKSGLTPSPIKYGKWTEEKHQAYIDERASAAANRIFGAIDAGWNPITNKPRRPLRIEEGPGVFGWTKTGYSPHSAWRNKRKNPYSDE